MALRIIIVNSADDASRVVERLKRGDDLKIIDVREPKETADRLRARFGVEAISLSADLSQRAAIEAMMADLLSRLGAIDILVNNAVVRHFAPVEAFPPEKWDEALAVNLSAPFHLIRLALPAMKRRNWGRIINMASIYSTRAVADRIDYVTTKTAILGVTRAVRSAADGYTLSVPVLHEGEHRGWLVAQWTAGHQAESSEQGRRRLLFLRQTIGVLP